MSDVLNAFKQESASRVAGRRKKREEEEQVQPQQKFQQDAQQKLLEQQQKQQQEAKQQESDNNVIRALAASQDNNVAQQSNKGSTEAERLAAAKAQDDAYNAQVDAYNSQVAEANRKAAEKQARAAEGKQDEGWKKYYNEEFEKEKPKNIWELIGSGHFLDDTFWDNTYRSLFDNGSTEKRAEVNARNRYTSDLLNQAYDDDGNVLNDWAANQAKNVSEYNMNVALDNSKRSAALTKAIGADADENDIGARIRGTFNAVRNANWGNPIAGVDINSEEFDGADAVRFFGGLLQGSASAPIVGVKNLQEAMSGKGLDKETGEDKDLSFGEIVGRTGSGLIDVAGPLIGGSGTLLKSLTKQGAKELGEQTLKQGVKKFITDMGKEGLEEAVQSGFEHFGEGGKLETKEDWNELVNNALQSAALGAIGGGAMSAAGLGAGKLGTALKNRIRNNTKVDEKEIVDRLNKIKELENRSTNTETNNTNINNKEYTGDIIMPDGTTLNTNTNTPTITTPEYTGDPRARLSNQSNEGNALMSNSPMTRLTNTQEGVATNFANPNSPLTATQQEIGVSSNPTFDSKTANQEQVSATGQKVNPQNYSEAVQNAEGTQAYNKRYSEVQPTLFDNNTNPNENVKIAGNYTLKDYQKELTPEQYQRVLNYINLTVNTDGSLDSIANYNVLNMIDRFYEENRRLKSKGTRKLFNSKENQDWLNNLGINERIITNKRKGYKGQYDPNKDVISIALNNIDSMPELQSTELHEAAHSLYARLKPEQKVAVANNLLEKIDAGFKLDKNEQAVYIEMDELIAYCIEERWQQENNVEGTIINVSKRAQDKLDDLALRLGHNPNDTSFKAKIINVVRSFVDYLKLKIGNFTDVKTFDEFYDGLVSGKFSEINQSNLSDINPQYGIGQVNSYHNYLIDRLKKNANKIGYNNVLELSNVIDAFYQGTMPNNEIAERFNRILPEKVKSFDEFTNRQKEFENTPSIFEHGSMLNDSKEEAPQGYKSLKDYYAKEKNKAAQFFKMSPDEYLQSLTKENGGVYDSVQDIINRSDKDKYMKYAEEMRNGKTFPALSIMYDENGYSGQEGIHRALAAKELGLKEIPTSIQYPANNPDIATALKYNLYSKPDIINEMFDTALPKDSIVREANQLGRQNVQNNIDLYNMLADLYSKYRTKGDMETANMAQESANILRDRMIKDNYPGNLPLESGIEVHPLFQNETVGKGFNQGKDIAEELIYQNSMPIGYNYDTNEEIWSGKDLLQQLAERGMKDFEGNKYMTDKQVRQQEEAQYKQAMDEALGGPTREAPDYKEVAETIKSYMSGYDENYDIGQAEKYTNYVMQADNPEAALGKVLEEIDTNNKKESVSSTEPIPVNNNVNNTTETQTTQEQEVPKVTKNEAANAYQQELQSIQKEVDDLGMNEYIYSKVTEANRNGQSVNDVLTPEEQKIYMDVLKLMDEKQAKENYDKAYLPQQYNEGGDFSVRLAEEAMMGQFDNPYIKSRQNAIDLGDINYSSESIADYILRNRNPKAALRYAIENKIRQDNPNATDEQVQKATDIKEKQVERMEKMDEKKITKSDKLDIYNSQQEIGNEIGISQDIDDTVIPFGISTFDKAKKISNHWNKGFGLQLILQKNNIVGANTREEIATAVRQQMDYVSDIEIAAANEKADKAYAFYYEKTNSKRLAEIKSNEVFLKECSLYSIFNGSEKVQFSNKATAKFFNKMFSEQVALERAKETVGYKIGKGLARIMNSSFRGMKWGTTMNEVSEITKLYSDFSKDGNKVSITYNPRKIGDGLRKYGIQSFDTVEEGMTNLINMLPPKERAEAIKLWKENTNADEKTILSNLKSIDKIFNKGMGGLDRVTQWNMYVQAWKDANYLLNAEKYYSEVKGLEGVELTQAVMKDFGSRMLPQDRIYKAIKSDSAISKPLLMYLDSQFRMTYDTLRGAVGGNTAGVNADMERHMRALNNMKDVIPRTCVAVMRGIPLAMVFNTPQMDDYSSIPDEEKNALDIILNAAAKFSPLGSVAVAGYNAYRQDELNAKRGNTDERGDWVTRTESNLRKTFTPLGGWLDQMFGYGGNQNNFKDVAERGYAMNKSGRVQYLAPDNPVDWVRALVGGMNYTSNAREYNNNPDLISALINQATNYDADNDRKTDGGLEDFFKYNAAWRDIAELINPSLKNDYNRPATQAGNVDYSNRIKNAQGEDRVNLYKQSREYNKFLDDLRVNNNDAYKVYMASFDGDIVPPERWARIAYGDNSSKEHSSEAVDLSIWHMLADRAKQWKNVSGQNYDPAYDLDDAHARRWLQYQSTATGEDYALKKIMQEDEGFWSDFFSRRSTYFDGIDFTTKEYTTPRTKAWSDLNKQYTGMMMWNGASSDREEDRQHAAKLQKNYPTMYAYHQLSKSLQNKYGDNWKKSAEYSAFWKQYGDAYNSEQEAYKTNMLSVVNQMRMIEGYDTLTSQEWDAITGIGKSSSKKSSGGKSYSSSDWSYAPKFSNTFNDKPTYFKGKKAKGFTWKTAPKANFKNIPLSEAVGYNPEDLETE